MTNWTIFHKKIIGLTQIFGWWGGGGKSYFWGLIFKILNISIEYKNIYKNFGVAMAPTP